MFDIGVKKMLTKTTIKIDSGLSEKIYSEYAQKATEKYVPPLFDEFLIKVSEKIENNLYQKEYGIEEGTEFVFNIYCKYHSATHWTLILFDTVCGKSTKRVNIDVNYKSEEECNDNEDNYLYDLSAFFFGRDEDEEPTEDDINSAYGLLTMFLSISYYIQHYSQLVEYSKIEVSPLKKSKSDKKTYNKGYEQKIKLKSRKNLYVITEDDFEENSEKKAKKKYNKIKPCWYVRGYYQHFGKEKVLKYIPPRINRRSDEKLRNTKPESGKYQITE